MSGGLPLVAREAFAALRGGGGLRVVGRTVELAPGGIERREGLGAEVGLAHRLALLPAELRELLGCCGVWRRPFSREEAQRVAPGLDGRFAAAWESPALEEFLVTKAGGRMGLPRLVTLAMTLPFPVADAPRRSAERSLTAEGPD